MGQDISASQRIEDMVRVTELCIDLLKENEEHHGEVASFFCFYLCNRIFSSSDWYVHLSLSYIGNGVASWSPRLLLCVVSTVSDCKNYIDLILH